MLHAASNWAIALQSAAFTTLPLSAILTVIMFRALPLPSRMC